MQKSVMMHGEKDLKFKTLTPSNITSFYLPTINNSILYQGDIIVGKKTGLEEFEDESYPDYWMIITKNCDLTLSYTLTTRKEDISIIPLFTLKYLLRICENELLYTISRSRKKVVLMAVWKLSKIFGLGKLSESNIKNLIENKITKFMYLPPDGDIFNEPMIVDFDLLSHLDGSSQKEVKSVLNAKVLQLASPFRERVAQRFANHYSNIGVDDEEIRDKPYIATLRNHLKQP